MKLKEIEWMNESGKLIEAIIEPASTGNGWQLDFKDCHGGQVVLTTDSGYPRLFHSIDSATDMTRNLGINQVRILEHF